MRILFLNPVGVLGGAERVLLDVIASLRPVLPAGTTMHLICLSNGPLLDEARKLGVQTTLVELPGRLSAMGESGLRGNKLAKAAAVAGRMVAASPAGLKFARRFRAAVLAIGADVIHSNGVKTHLLTRLLPRRAGKVVWHIHDLLGNRALLSGALRHAAGHTSIAIAISQAVAEDLKTVLPRVPVTTILNGIDTDHFSPGRVDPRTDAACLDRLASLPPPPANTCRIGLVATYARWKGQDLFLKAAASLDAGVAARFYIVGGSIYQTAGSQYSRDELAAVARSLGIENRVGFVGFQNDPVAVYRALDVMVHASTKPEPFGRTIAEAMACGRAVIVSNAGGAAELFENGVDAIGVSPGSSDQLATAMRELIADPVRRSLIGTRARATAVARFDRNRLGSQFLRAYERAISDRAMMIDKMR